MSLASGGISGTRSTRGSVITDRKSLSRRYSAVLRVYTWPTRVCCCWGGRGRATHEYSKERIHSALGLGSPWRLVLCVHHTTRITIVISLPGRFRPKSGMERLRRSLTSTACDVLMGLGSAAPRLSSAPCAAAYCRLSNLLSPPAKGDNKATITAAVLKRRPFSGPQLGRSGVFHRTL